MNREIRQEDLKGNSFFWYYYISWFRGHDDIKDISIDEALEVIDIDREEVYKWGQLFFPETEAYSRYIGWEINAEISFVIEFQEYSTIFYINDIYIGNLGGHFEAWFLTWDELLAFQDYKYLFLLLLPMTGVEAHQADEALTLITNQLKDIPMFETECGYIANCILNGMRTEEGFFHMNGVGTVNNQNHSVRNIEKYPDYKEGVAVLNLALSKFIAGKK